MFTQKSSRLNLAAFLLALPLSSGLAAAHASPLEKSKAQPGFIQDDRLLQPVPAPDGIKAYRYVRPGVNRDAYTAVMIEPVIIRQDPADKMLSSQVIADTRLALQAAMRKRLGEHLTLVDRPGPGTVRVEVSISGAQVEKEGFKPRNLLPISAVIAVASRAAGKEQKHAVLLIESQVTDSQTGQLLRAGMVTLSSRKFRNRDDAARAFEGLAVRAVEFAIR